MAPAWRSPAWRPASSGFTFWALALPFLLPELRQWMRAERAGVLFVFLTACSADYVDAAFGFEQRVTVMLVTTSLVSVLITSNGHVLVGAVAPSVLYSAAAQLR